MRSPVSLRTPLQGTFMGSSAYTRARFGPVLLWHPAARCCFFPSFSILSQLSKDYWCLCVWQRVFGSYHFFGEGVVGFGHLHCLPLIRLQLIYCGVPQLSFQIPPLTIERKQIKIARIRDPFKNKGFGRLVWHQCCCCCWQKDMRLKTGKTWQDQSCYEPCKVLARADVHVWKPAVYRNEWNISTHFAPVASGQ